MRAKHLKITALHTLHVKITEHVLLHWLLQSALNLFLYFFAYPIDSYVREALQDIAGCTLQSWGHMTLHLDSHMAAHSRARKSLDRILQ